ANLSTVLVAGLRFVALTTRSYCCIAPSLSRRLADTCSFINLSFSRSHDVDLSTKSAAVSATAPGHRHRQAARGPGFRELGRHEWPRPPKPGRPQTRLHPFDHRQWPKAIDLQTRAGASAVGAPCPCADSSA